MSELALKRDCRASDHRVDAFPLITLRRQFYYDRMCTISSVVCVSTPISAKPNRRPERDSLFSDVALWRLFDCLVGGVAAAIVFLLSLPMLTEAAHTLQMLSSTGLVFVLLFAWLFFWLASTIARTLLVGYSTRSDGPAAPLAKR